MFKPAFVSHALLLYADFAFSQCLAIEKSPHLFSFAIAALLVLSPPREESEQYISSCMVAILADRGKKRRVNIRLPFWQREREIARV